MSETDVARDTAMTAAAWALQKNAESPVLLRVDKLCSYTDYLLIVGGQSTRQVRAIAEGISLGMKRAGYRAIGREGVTEGRWAVLDFGEVVVHIFLYELREEYDLEGLWIDAPRVDIEPPSLLEVAEPRPG